ncbi:zinc ribbon domain-containing protein [Halogeometricum borinquense]|uniref:Zinc ribbon domain-containing protein n=1 Tax=Halogeometricum borinquense TaxID=60847 RepID=A0A6C0UHH6_9EURY|nr:zinc ribbon domain-containing protein [Halogeometricum borinquense]QIB75004.1 zinc ribbon domain-containing protein [Halogeometricum borinquense]QIQ76018.1 zinc ribbon domain-containing protein [Halogeometricum borinquense]
MDWEITFRLLLTAFCIVAPTLLYVGLVRGLNKLREDPFVERVLLRMDEEFESGTRASGGPPQSFLSLSSSRSSDLPHEATDRTSNVPSGATCSRCGAPNPSYAAFCDVCLARISD